MDLIQVNADNLTKEHICCALANDFESILIDSFEKAQSAPAPITRYALFYNGDFITNEILSAAKFEKLARLIIEERKETQ